MSWMAAVLAATLLEISAGDLADKARNLEDFDYVVARLRADYAGYGDKVPASAVPELDELVAKTRRRVGECTDAELPFVMRELLRFFKDNHLGILAMEPAATPAPASAPSAKEGDALPGKAESRTANSPPAAWTEPAIRETLARRGHRHSPIEGIWESGGIDSGYVVGIIRRDGSDTYDGVVLSSNRPALNRPGPAPGDVFELSGESGGALSITSSKNGLGQRVVARLCASDSALVFEWPPNVCWIRTWPPHFDFDRVLPSGAFFIKRLSPKTLWLRVPDFQYARTQELERVLAEHNAELETTENLLIDARNNAGGSDSVYEPLVPYLYSRPIYTVSVEFWSSPGNIAVLEGYSTQDRDAQDKERLREVVGRLRERPAEFVCFSERAVLIDRREEVKPNPKRVAILIDGAGSSGEQFILTARQSRKVTLFGQRNSAGTLDYSNVAFVDLPSGRFRLAYPMSRSLRLPEEPIDQIGIEPDIRIPADVVDPVAYAHEWLERQAD